MYVGYTALDRLSKGLMKDIAGMTKMRGGLQIGDVKDKYRVYTYALTAQANMPSLSKMSIPAVVRLLFRQSLSQTINHLLATT